MFQALSAPGSPGVQDKRGITGRGRNRTAAVAELRTKIAAGIETRVGNNPANPIQAEGLFLASWRRAGVQQRVAEARRAVAPYIRAVGPAAGQERGHAPEHALVRRRTIGAYDSRNAAHRDAVLEAMVEASKAANCAGARPSSFSATPSSSTQA